ncbi:hypothetical protein FQR65_LT16608 [Abscondita terminalis]|nr:hypothetical protein FQR65_LT16608 [Abscondita terminalis]
MKYPSCILKGDRAQGDTISIAVAKKGVYQDAGSKMIHLGKDTKSKIVSKSMTFQGGTANYRGLVYIGPEATGSKARVECDTLILDNQSHSDTIPKNKVHNNKSQIEHEATVSKVSEEQLFYLMSRGLDEMQALEIIIMGFLEPFTKELPLEYAVELNQLIKMDMEEYGAFCNIKDSEYSGLIHISELSDYFVNNIKDFFDEGEEVTVTVIDLNPEKKQAKLSYKRSRPELLKNSKPSIKETGTGYEKLKEFTDENLDK